MSEPARKSNDAASSTSTSTSDEEEKEESRPSSPAEEPDEKEETEQEEEKDAKSDEKEERVVPRGNPLRRARGGITAGAAGFLAFALMAHNGQLRWSVPLGFMCVLVAAWGVMDVLGTFDDSSENVVRKLGLGHLVGPLSTTLAAGMLVCCALMGGQSGWGPQWVWGLAVTITFIALVVAVFRFGAVLGPWAYDENGEERPIWKRHGFWLVVLASILYLPMLGSYSLWDPWETHYGEVAREMLARDDWVSLWWAQDGWFWSKPILNFWIQGLAMGSLGTHFRPDEMLQGWNGPTAHPEWVVRFPNFLLTIVAMYVLYKAVARVYGRRTALIGGAVLATMPDWYFLAHQTMTDMPFVAPMAATIGFAILGLASEPEQRVRLYEVDAPRRWLVVAGITAFGLYLVGTVGALGGRTAAIACAIVAIAAIGLVWKSASGWLAKSTIFRLSGWHLVFGVVLAAAIPQVLYLLSRNIELVLHGDGPYGFRPHFDEFHSGSGGGNCGMPGNEACNLVNPASVPRAAGAHPATIGLQLLRLFGGFEPVVQVLLWTGTIAGLLYLNWGERRTQRLYYLAAWFAAAIATMGKGPAGFGLPVICIFLYIATRQRWTEILRFEAVSGLLIIAAVAIPWYVAMYVRHGSPFTDRLIFHDMFNRAFHHVHDTNEGDDTSFRFYLWQLGYALYPWSGLAPLGFLWWARRGKEPNDGARMTKGDVSTVFVMYAVFGYFLFSFMGTKFHHYIFPVVPAIAMLLGIALGESLGDGPLTRRSPLWAQLAMYAGAAMVAVIAITAFIPGTVLGTEQHWVGVDKILLGVGFGLLAAPIAAKMLGLEKEEPPPDPDKKEEGQPISTDHESVMFGAVAFGAAMLLFIIGRDLWLKTGEGGDQPGAIRLLHLFTYNYRRGWPETLDFHAVLVGFALPVCFGALLLAVKAIRRHAVLMFCSLAFVWALWGLDVYMVATAPHWGQHEVIQAYYQNRGSANEPLIAYQMNWKGENFYTGNKVPAFVSSGANFTNWVRQQKDKGVKVMFFVTEHSRTGGLRSEVGAKNYKEITDKKLCNKFVLVRAEL
jgi:4-amino-4-deoxy-L-arabinose transferase-like glycosyltransferase